MDDYKDRHRTYMSASQGPYVDARDRATGDRDRAALPHIAQLLTANGHSPDKAVEIIRVAQRSWSKNLT
jgi:hypothetical protein